MFYYEAIPETPRRKSSTGKILNQNCSRNPKIYMVYSI